ncbi:MAG: hypothetical protein NT062_04825 [Proteobacteria bacterium]|nr:hypothetical protein [Pseudomonadota bacterium]
MDHDQEPTKPQTFGHKHAITIMTSVMAALLTLVIAVQVGC